MKTLKLSLLAIILLFSHCKKSVPPSYTVNGVILQGSGIPAFAGQTVQLEVVTQLQYGSIQSAILGSCVINDSGKFSFTYPQTNITDRGAYLRIDIQVEHFGNFPVNQNENANVSTSSQGILAISLQTSSPLEKIKDTLFISYIPLGANMLKVDTITQTVNGFWQKIFQPTWTSAVGVVNPIMWKKGSRGTRNFINPIITGSPFIDSTTINY